MVLRGAPGVGENAGFSLDNGLQLLLFRSHNPHIGFQVRKERGALTGVKKSFLREWPKSSSRI